MPCNKMNHTHAWPASGPLTIERCERFCDYCTSEADRNHYWKFAWFLRRHVESVHIKSGEYSNVQMAKGWTRAVVGYPRRADGKPKKAAPKKRASKVVHKPSPTPSPSQPSSASAIQVAGFASASPSHINQAVPDAFGLQGTLTAQQQYGDVYGLPQSVNFPPQQQYGNAFVDPQRRQPSASSLGTNITFTSDLSAEAMAALAEFDTTLDPTQAFGDFGNFTTGLPVVDGMPA